MWALEKSIFDKIQAAVARGEIATEAQVMDVGAAIGWSVDDVLKVSGDVGTIQVQGVLTRNPNFMAAIFGGGNTTYSALIEAISAADADDDVKEIVLEFNSPGGTLDGFFDTVDMLNATEKPTRSRVDLAASAAYGLASVTDTIEANGRGSQVGSVGTVVDMVVNDRVVSITNTESPDKRPDPTTEEGRESIQAYLDDAFGLFASAIANGRGETVKTVTEKFGRGRMFFAAEAEARGMVDTVAGAAQNSPDASASGGEIEATETESKQGDPMDLNELKAKHPELFASIVESTLAAERARVNAHLHMGQESGDMKTAIEAIEKGDEMSPELTSKYVMAAAKKATISAREDDNVDDVVTDGEGEDGDDAEKDAQATADLTAKIAARLNLEV